MLLLALALTLLLLALCYLAVMPLEKRGDCQRSPPAAVTVREVVRCCYFAGQGLFSVDRPDRSGKRHRPRPAGLDRPLVVLRRRWRVALAARQVVVVTDRQPAVVLGSVVLGSVVLGFVDLGSVDLGFSGFDSVGFSPAAVFVVRLIFLPRIY